MTVSPRKTVLLIEDDAGDARHFEIMLDRVPNHGFGIEWVQRLRDGIDRLTNGGVDVVLLDLSLPDSEGLATFQALHSAYPNLPVVVLTGRDDEESAINALAQGAQDYLPKNRMDGFLLARSLRYAQERQKLITALQEALARVKTLSGLLPICAHCKNIRDDAGYWQKVEAYIADRSDACFTHALCPSCVRKLYPDLADRVIPEKPAEPVPWTPTLLVVDDDPVVRKIVTEIAGKLGCHAMPTETADEAVRLIEQSDIPIDAVITDWHLPGSNGMEVIREARRYRPGIPIIVASGQPLNLLPAGLADDADVSLLPKPFRLDKLKELLGQLKVRRLQQA